MILSHKQIEEIAAAVTKDFNEFFFGKHAALETHYAQATPIDWLATDYLGLRVSYAHLSEDGSICGLTAYADTEYAATYRGTTRIIPLRANEVLLDSSFMEPGQVKALCGKRRFTLAHECAHQILFQLEPDEAQRVREASYIQRAAYSLRDLKNTGGLERVAGERPGRGAPDAPAGDRPCHELSYPGQAAHRL